MIFLGFIALIPAGIITVLAFSKKTSPAVRKASIAALVLIAVVFAACTIILFVMFGSSPGTSLSYSEFPVEPVQEIKKDYLPVLIASIAIFVFLIWIMILAVRERRKK